MLSPGITISTPCGQIQGSGNIGSPNIELRFVAGEERSMTSAFLFAQDIDLDISFGMGFNAAGSGNNLTALDISTLNTSEQEHQLHRQAQRSPEVYGTFPDR